MLAYQQAVIEVAQETLAARVIGHLEGKAPEELTVFPVNSYVLVAYPRSAMGRKPPNKLTAPWRGPLRVVSFDANEYTLQNLVTGKLELQHVTCLKSYNYDPKRTTEKDLVEVSNMDTSEFLVDRILDHTGDPSYKTEMLRWEEGLSSDFDLWLPWSELRKLHEYIKLNRLPIQIKRETEAESAPVSDPMETRARKRVRFEASSLKKGNV